MASRIALRRAGARMAPAFRSTIARAAGTEAQSAASGLASHFSVNANPTVEPASDPKLTQALITINDSPGSLRAALDTIEKCGVNMTQIESRPSKDQSAVEFEVTFEGRETEPRIQQLLSALLRSCSSVQLTAAKAVPWFPKRIEDLDSFTQKTLDAGGELESDHPGFNDAAYRARRASLTENARAYRHGQPIPRVEYTAEEVETWGAVYARLREYFPKYASQSFNKIVPEMEEHCGYGVHSVPQLQDISQYLTAKTGFSLRPVAGLLSGRDFLNALAFRVFFSTQYIRHHSVPFYTPEPDICHELMGHAPMFADPDFADFSHEIGLASLGASDADIKRLATLYWFTVEFGLCMEGDRRVAVGAGLLSSFGELEYACSPTRPAGGRDVFPEYRPFQPLDAIATEYPICDYQPTYFVADSIEDMKLKTREFCRTLHRPMHLRWNPYNRSVSVDRPIKEYFTAEQLEHRSIPH